MKHHLHGPLGMLAGYALFSFVPVAVKLAFARGAGAPVAVFYTNSFGGQILFTAGYKDTSIQLGTLLSLTTPVAAVVNGWLFLSEPITLRFVLGAIMILCACGGMSVMEKRRPSNEMPHDAREGRPA
jgi:drug/metabolite transporter (DMT)-like permease